VTDFGDWVPWFAHFTGLPLFEHCVNQSHSPIALPSFSEFLRKYRRNPTELLFRRLL
jgi:hypothetical protein